jgi:hypothetical protein
MRAVTLLLRLRLCLRRLIPRVQRLRRRNRVLLWRLRLTTHLRLRMMRMRKMVHRVHRMRVHGDMWRLLLLRRVPRRRRNRYGHNRHRMRMRVVRLMRVRLMRLRRRCPDVVMRVHWMSVRVRERMRVLWRREGCVCVRVRVRVLLL